jgi:hypothetical protein
MVVMKFLAELINGGYTRTWPQHSQSTWIWQLPPEGSSLRQAMPIGGDEAQHLDVLGAK